MTNRCRVPRCRGEVEVTYLDHGICYTHWNQLTAEGKSPGELRMVLGIEATVPTAISEEEMAEKKTETKSKKSAKATKEVKAKKEKVPNQDLVVFAFRLPKVERDAIHAAAGPGGATRFVRAVAIAAAREDDAAYRQAITEARDARA